jgi:transcriptional regulator
LSVPTWNYAAVHAYGIPRLVEEETALYQILEATVRTYEAPFDPPWRLDLPNDFMDRMMNAIVGFEIEITRLEGKVKLSQNRSMADQQRVAAALEQQDDPQAVEVAAMMRRRTQPAPSGPAAAGTPTASD